MAHRKAKPIPEVIQIAVLRLAAREGGIVAALVKTSVYEALRRERLLLSITHEKRPGCALRVMYRPTKRGLAVLRKHEKKVKQAA